MPGGQDLYVTVDGQILITVQHSHSFPQGSWPEYYGWTWYPLPVKEHPLEDCPADDEDYDCRPPTGFWRFQAPNSTVGGIVACQNKYNANVTSVYAITPEFNQTNCIPLLGLGTHPYSGPNPPVWAY